MGGLMRQKTTHRASKEMRAAGKLRGHRKKRGRQSHHWLYKLGLVAKNGCWCGSFVPYRHGAFLIPDYESKRSRMQKIIAWMVRYCTEMLCIGIVWRICCAAQYCAGTFMLMHAARKNKYADYDAALFEFLCKSVFAGNHAAGKALSF